MKLFKDYKIPVDEDIRLKFQSIKFIILYHVPLSHIQNYIILYSF